jgi:Transglycosylase-like domain/LysM domain
MHLRKKLSSVLAATAAAVALGVSALAGGSAPAAPAQLAVHTATVQRTVAATTYQRPITVYHRALVDTYTVRPGDTLSSIAANTYGSARDWPVLYWANRDTVRWADDISPGQTLTVPALPATIPAPPTALAPAPPPQPVYSEPAVQVQAQAVAYQQPATSYSGGGGFQSCVIARESGGNPNVMNATGHYGLYQFSEPTWEEYGGSASDFGDASVAEQNAVFDSAMAQGGESNWSPYDGC